MNPQSLQSMSKLLDVLVRTTGDPGDLTGTLQHLAQTAQGFFAADSCVIFAINPITGKYIASLTVAGNLLRGDKVSYKEPSARGLAQQVLRQGLLVVEDLEVKPEYQSTVTRTENIHAFAGLALCIPHNRRPLGVLYLNFRHQRQFDSDDLELFQIFAEQASFLLQETWLLWRHQEVARIGQEINYEFSTIDILFQKLRENVISILDTSYAFLLAAYQPQTSTLDMYMEEEGHPIIRDNYPLQGACQYVIEKQQTVFIRQYSKEARHQPFQFADLATGTGLEESLIFVPLVFRDVPLGVLSIQNPQPNAYDQEDLSILQLLAPHIALALHNMRLYNSLDQLSKTGQLLTQQLDSEQALQATVDKIQDAAKADTVVLYLYESALWRFLPSPIIAGPLLDSATQSMSSSRPHDTVALMAQHKDPIFAKNSASFYMELHGNSYIWQGSFGQREQVRSIAAVPLRVGEELVGVLFVNFRQPQRFDATQKLFIDGLAHFAAVAIKNARTFGTLIQQRMRELEILQNIDRELSRNLELKPVLDTLLKLGRERVPADRASIMLYNSRTQTLMTEAAIGLHAESRQAIRGIAWWVLEQKKPVRVDNVHLDPLRDVYIPTADTVSELDVPLLDGDAVIGVLNFESTRECAFRQEDEDFLLTLAGQAVLAIKNAQAYEREKRLADEAQVLNEISKEITSHLDPAHVFDLILEKALELTHSNLGNLMLYDPKQHDLWMAAERGVAEDKKGQRQRLDQGVVGYAARNKQMLNVDLTQPPWNEIYLAFFPGARSELAVPMLAGDVLWGVLNIESCESNNFKESDERLLMGLASLAIVALQNAQAYEREKRLLEEAHVLNSISKEITSQLDLKHVFDLILEKALELTHSTLGSLHLYDSDQNDLSMAAERGVAEDKKGQRQRLGQGVVGSVARNKRLINVGDVLQPPWKEIYLNFIPKVRSELAVPMLAGNDLRGVLNVESPIPNNFSESDERLLQGLAGMAVVALQNAQAYEREKRLVVEGQLLNTISKEITSQLNPAHVFDLILEKALELTHSRLGALLLYDPDQKDLGTVAARGISEDKKSVRLTLQQGIVGHVAKTRKLVNADLSQQSWKEIYVELVPGMQSELAVPMLARDDLCGVLYVESPAPKNFSESDERLLQGLADMAAVALQNAQAYEREKRLLEEAHVLNEISKEITSQLDLAHVFDLILKKALELTHSTLGGLLLFDPDLNELRTVVAHGMTEDKKNIRLSLQQGVVGYAAKNKKLLNVDLTEPPWDDIYLEFIPRVRSELAVPMLAGNDLRGVLNIESPTPNNFSESDERLLQGLADMAVVALQNAQAYEHEKRLAAEAQVLNEISKEIISQLDLTRIFDFILEKALELTRSTVGALLLYNPDLEDLWVVANHGLSENKKGVCLGLQQGIVGYAASNKRLINADLSQPAWKEMYVEFDLGNRMCSELAVPMLAGNDLRGVLNVESPIPRNFNESDERLLQGLGDLAVVALQNAERYEQAKQEVQRFDLLYQAGQELGKISELTQLEYAYDIVLHIAEKYSNGHAIIRRYEEETQELLTIPLTDHQYPAPFPQIKLNEDINGQVARERRTIVIYDTARPYLDVDPVKLSNLTIGSLIITPIIFKERYYGNINLSHKEVGHFRDADVHFLEGLTQQLASTIYRLETAQERKEFEQRAISAEGMSSIGQIAFELTHRWGNDLGLVRSYINDIRSELTSLNVMTPFITEKLENIVRAAGAVLNLSKELKQALVRTGESITNEPVMLEARILLEEAQDSVSVPSNVQVCLEIDDDVFSVKVIRSLVADILRNLMTNAIDAMPEGGKIMLKAHNAGRFVALEVIDTGLGIPQESLSKIFNLFYSTKGSSGFGLWSARTNALRNQGDLTVKSQEGQGTTFTLLLPRAER